MGRRKKLTAEERERALALLERHRPGGEEAFVSPAECREDLSLALSLGEMAEAAYAGFPVRDFLDSPAGRLVASGEADFDWIRAAEDVRAGKDPWKIAETKEGAAPYLLTPAG